ncbi:MAG TPA: ribosome small subunit-dependent GTPase A [Gaiellales bacterium]
MNIASLGWGDALAETFQEHADAGLRPGRVAIQHRGAYVLLTEDGEVWAGVRGRLRHAADSTADLPAVGDWVAYDHPEGAERAAVHAILPRRSAFRRKQAGYETAEQVVAANVDVLFLVTSLNQDLNVRRIERYMTLAWESGADPVVVLTKADLCADVQTAVALVETVTFGVPVHVTSALTGEGFDALRAHLEGGRTGAAVGSSGVGKSTLINHLAGEERLATRDIRSDGRGRHTTTHRELIVLPGTGCVIDTPGMRELQLWDSEEGLEKAFEDVETLILECRFSDCAHETEPGCAVRSALDDGRLESERFESYRKLQRELRWLETRHDARARSEERKRWRAVNKEARARARP